MATKQAGGVQSDIRTEFTIKEGSYRNVKASEHCRPSRQALFSKELSPVQISFVSCKGKDGMYEWIVFNSNKELYFYLFEGVGKVPDLKHPLDKRVYKAPTIPVCHDFNSMTRSTEHLDLVVGFSTGPLQYLSPLDKQAICAFNEDGSIDSTRVTCIKWVPGSENSFVSSHRSGNLYVWTTENHATYKNINSPMSYVTHKSILDAKICAVKQRNKFPLLFRWTVGHGPINAFAFSPNSVHLAISSQDGFLRIYDFHKQEIYGRMRSYFGGLLCVCWSPDGQYVVTGGEDDLLTVWSFEHKKVVARGEGHQSYINVVAFDPYMTVLPSDNNNNNSSDKLNDTDEKGGGLSSVQTQAEATSSSATPPEIDDDEKKNLYSIGRHLSVKGTPDESFTTYRLGSVGQDTRLCLWDLSGDSLKMRRLIGRGRSRVNRQSRPVSLAEGTDMTTAVSAAKDALNSSREKGRGDERGSSPDKEGGDDDDRARGKEEDGSSLISNHFADSNPAEDENDERTRRDLSVPANLYSKESSPSVSLSSTSSSVSSKKEKKRKKDKKTKDKPLKQHRNTLKEPMRKVMKFVGSGFTNSNPTSNHNHARRTVGTFETCNSDDIAPKMLEVNHVEPLVAEKISQERLTALVFREDCFLTACQEGFISTWARPGVCMSEEVGSGGGGVSQPSPSTNTGINSPKPSAAMDHDSPVKSTAI